MNYSENDLEQYNEYMNFVYSTILDTNIPKRTKKRMLNGTRIEVKDNTNWFIRYKQDRKDNVLSFMSFHQWFKIKKTQENRASKLNQLLNA
jgi:hypothetical protein